MTTLWSYIDKDCGVNENPLKKTPQFTSHFHRIVEKCDPEAHSLFF